MAKWLEGVKRTREEVANTIEDFITGSGGPWDWDDFISIKLKDPELEKIRLTCVFLSDTHPPKQKNQYCNEEGVEILKGIVRSLRSST